MAARLVLTTVALAAGTAAASALAQSSSVPNATPQTASGPIQGDTQVQGSFPGRGQFQGSAGPNASSEYWYFYTAVPNATVTLRLFVNTQTATCGGPSGCAGSTFTATIIDPDGARLQTVDASNDPNASGQYTLPKQGKYLIDFETNGYDHYDFAFMVSPASALTSVPPPAPTAAPAATVLRGKVKRGGKIALKVQNVASKIVGLSVTDHHRCADGARVTDNLSALSGAEAVAIQDGRFSFQLTFSPNHYSKSVNVVVHGSYHGSSAGGTIAVTDHSRHHGVCKSGVRKWTANAA
jgi:hypothetical protein